MVDSLDLIFLIDTTDSMAPYIASVKAEAETIAGVVAQNVTHYRMAVITYRDFPISPFGEPGDYVFRNDLGFSDTKQPVIDALMALTVGGGGDIPEAVLSAFIHATAGDTGLGGWRGTAVPKRIIVMGDAPPHDPEPFTFFTMKSATDAAMAQDPVTAFTLAIGPDPSAVSSFQALADGTGGEFFHAATAADVVPALLVAEAFVILSAVSQPPTLALVGLGAAILLACAEYWRRRQAATS